MSKWIKELLYKSSKNVGNSIESKLEQLLYLIKTAKFFSRENIPLFSTRYKMFDHIIENFKLDGQNIAYLEFGVWQGESIKYWASKNGNDQSVFFGFDTFEGLPESYGALIKGHFSTNGETPKSNDGRISFYKGLFQDTLTKFVAQNKELLISKKKVIHLDADLYSSTLYVLLELYPYCAPGDIILFDEFFTLTKNSEEFRAFMDFSSIRDFQFKCIAKTDKQLAIVRL